ncbi:MAG: hypothetical protein ACJA13_004082 [Paraglaciecola sp.]|jgi:hypothetical protein
MVNRNFPAHGNLNIYIDEGLLVINGRGPANTEMVLRYQREVHSYRQKLCASPWASLTILTGEPLLPPEATGMMVEAIKSGQALNLVATAVVMQDVQYKSMSQQFWRGIYEQTTLPFQFFDSQYEARLWLQEQIKTHSP